MSAKRYLLVALTSGLYLFKWIILLFDDVNKLLGYSKYNASLIAKVLVALLGVNFISILLLIIFFQNDYSFTGIVILKYLAISITVSLFFWFIFSLVRIYGDVLRLQNKKLSVWNVLTVIILTFIMYASFPYVQVKINRSLSKPTAVV